MNASQISSHTHGTPRARKVVAPPAVDIYGPVHKGLRFAFGRALTIVGNADPTNAASVRVALDTVRQLLDICVSHLQHENDFILSAIAARRPGAEAALSHDHVEHLESIATLRDEVDACERAVDAHRMNQLYLQLAFFVGENLTHMNEEETLAQPLLHEIYTPAELLDIEQRLVASIPPEKAAVYMQFMLAGLSPQGRLDLVAGPRSMMPPEVFPGWLESVVVHLSDRDANALFAALGISRLRTAAS